MTKGKKVLGDIRKQVKTLQEEDSKLSTSLSASEARITRLTEEREQTYDRLAQFYLPSLDAETVQKTLHEKQEVVRDLFQQQQDHRKRVEAQLRENHELREGVNTSLDSIVSTLGDQETAINQVRGQIAEELQQNPEYQTALRGAQLAHEKVAQLQKQYDSFKEQATQNLKAYRDNKFFTYLEKRGFATDEQQGNRFSRFFDRLVAQRINYSSQKAKYDRLLFLPKAMERLVKETDDQRAELVAGVRRLEAEVETSHNLPTLRDEYDLFQKKKRDKTSELERLDEQNQRYAVELHDLESTKGAYHKQAIGNLKSYLKGQNIAALKARVRDTPGSEDDSLVERIEQIDLEVRQLKDQAKDVKKQRESRQEKINGLRTLERNFVAKDYEIDRSYFSSGFDPNSFLVGYLAGQYSLPDVTRAMESHHHFEPLPQPTYSSSPSTDSSPSSWGSFDSGSGFGDSGGFSSGDGF